MVTSSSLTVDVTMTETNLQTPADHRLHQRCRRQHRNVQHLQNPPVQRLQNLFAPVRAKTIILTDTIIPPLPGVVAARTRSRRRRTPTSWSAAALLQTRVTIDGHIVSSGTVGEWNTNYAAPGIFANADVVKGAGLNGAIAGESVFGTVNLRTRDFTCPTTPRGPACARHGRVQFGGFYNVFADVNFFNDKANLIVQKAVELLRRPVVRHDPDPGGLCGSGCLQQQDRGAVLYRPHPVGRRLLQQLRPRGRAHEVPLPVQRIDLADVRVPRHAAKASTTHRAARTRPTTAR